MGRVKISSSMQFGCVFWGSMKKYIHIYTYIHIWFIWYCNWICFFPRCCIHTVYLPEKFSHKMQVRILHTSSQSYTIICMYNIPKTWCFCSTWTRRPTGCVQTTRNVGGFIEKKVSACETEWSSMPLRASRKSVSCVWWKAKSVHWRARIPCFRKQNKLLENKKCCFGEVSRILFFLVLEVQNSSFFF